MSDNAIQKLRRQALSGDTEALDRYVYACLRMKLEPKVTHHMIHESKAQPNSMVFQSMQLAAMHTHPMLILVEPGEDTYVTLDFNISHAGRVRVSRLDLS